MARVTGPSLDEEALQLVQDGGSHFSFKPNLDSQVGGCCCFVLVVAMNAASAGNFGIAAAFAGQDGSLALVFANLTGYALLLGISRGIEAHCSRAKGIESCAAVAIAGSSILALAAVIILSVWIISAEDIFTWLGVDSESSRKAGKYMQSLSFHLPLVVIAHPLRALVAFVQHSSVMKLCIGLGMALGINLGISFVRGGILGLILAELLNILFMLLTLWNRLQWKVAFKDCVFSSPASKWKGLVQTSIASCLGTCLEHWCYQTVALKYFPIFNLDIVPYSMQAALESYSCWQVGKIVETRPSTLHSTVVNSMYTALLSGLAYFTLLMVYTSISTSDTITFKMLSLVGLIQFFNFIMATSKGILAGCELQAVGTLTTFVSLWIIGLPLTMILSFALHSSMSGVLSGLLVGTSISAALSVVAVLRIERSESQIIVELCKLRTEEVHDQVVTSPDYTSSEEDEDD